jgi:hypothetical protein
MPYNVQQRRVLIDTLNLLGGGSSVVSYRVFPLTQSSPGSFRLPFLPLLGVSPQWLARAVSQSDYLRERTWDRSTVSVLQFHS